MTDDPRTLISQARSALAENGGVMCQECALEAFIPALTEALEAAEAKAKDYRTAIVLLVSDLSWAKGFLDVQLPREFHSLDKALAILEKHEEGEQQ